MPFEVLTMNWSPWHTNPLDHIDKDLVTVDGDALHIRRDHSGDFRVVVDGEERIRTDSNLMVCDFLNNYGAGVWKEMAA